ncbi:MAG: GntP family permease [candidate division KSB1 bacterium]|nr:GntP family permease [candidate division KSB1 bacterium]
MLIFFLLFVLVGLMILATTRWKLHPFLALLLAALAMGFVAGLDPASTIVKITEGFGGTLKSIGIVIACGTIIGTFLERSGAAQTLAATVLKAVGEKRAPLAMNLTGFLVSIPVFCDSGFVILAALNRALNRKTKISLAVLAVALATGLYATHVFVPPTPGPLAAAAALQADLGLVLLLGLVVAVPSALAGLLWALWYARRFRIDAAEVPAETAVEAAPGAARSFAPIVVPILLIALKSVADYPTAPLGRGFLQTTFDFIGHPVVALLIGVFLAFALKTDGEKSRRMSWVGDGLKNAGVIILITGAGGAFGQVLRATDLGQSLGQGMTQWHFGVFLPFLIAAVLKSAQGSSTVSIITTAAMVAPLLEPMSMASGAGRALAVLAIGAGAMTVSHVNDSYFWVVAQFSDMDTATALRCQTLATLVQGVAGIVVIALLAWILV